MNIENKTICLNMIVKNESKIIVRMLSSVLPLIDSYCICDTGSTDDTKDIITTFFNNHNIPGKIVSEPFRNFGYNRTFALQQCDGMPNSEYLLLMDADMVLKISETLQISQLKKTLTADAYNIFQGTHSFMYQNIRLIKNNKNCSYWGVTHEYINLPQGSVTANIEKTQLFINDIGDGGSKSDKYIRDIKLLLQGLKEKPNNDRYTFYLANSYKDSGQYQHAIDTYKKRIELSGWIQEKYISCLRIYDCYTHLKQTENALYYLVKSFSYDKERFECVFELIKYYCQHDMNDVAYSYYSIVKSFYETKYLTSSIDGKLFLDISKADFYLPYYMIIVADRVKEAETGIQMYRTIFTKKYVETNHFYTRNILFNLQFFIDKVHEDQISEFIQLFKNYIQFLLSNNYPVYDNDFMDKYVKYGIEVPAKTQKPNFSKSECSNSNKILIYTGFMTDLWNDTYLSENSLGGSEKAVAYVSRYLPKHFDIYISGDVKDEVVGNITYINRHKLQSLLDTEKFHTIIVSRYVSFFLLYKQFSCYQLFLSAHDSTGFLNNITSNTVTTHSIINKWNDVIDGAVCLTDWHKQQIMNEHPCLANKMHTINNGIVTDSFPSIKTKTKNKFVWTSCSYRGLYTLLKMWDDILVHIPDATLSISSYETFPKNEQDNEMLQIINRHSSISHHGKLNPEQLYELLSTAEYWLYTSDFKETSCITSLEMLMSEVICLYYPLAGLTDTLGDYGIQLQCGNEISTLLNLSDEDKINIRKKGKEYAMSCSWENRALQWSEMLDMKQRLNWAFYCSPQFEKKMVQLYIDNLNNIYPEYYIFLTSDRNKIIKNIHSKVTFVYEIFDDDLISILPNVEFSYLNTEPLNLDCRLQSVKTILNNYPKMKYYDYSKSNLKILQEESIDIKNKIYLPYKCSRDELKTLIELNENTKKEYDFGIIKASGGYVNDRRQIVVDYLKQQKFTVNIIGGWGNDRDIELAKCRAILNIHGFYRVPSNIFEHIRCDRLLDAGFTVLSETSYKLDEQFVNKYPNLKQIDYEDFFNVDIINRVLHRNICFIHSCHLKNKGLKRLEYLIDKIKTTGLIHHLETIYINNIGIPIEKNIYGDKFKICNYSDNPALYEIPTINKIQQFSKENTDCNILYLHSKGISYDDNNQKENDWVDMMLYFLVERFELCLEKMNTGIQAVGCNYYYDDDEQMKIRNPKHFSGNFWWGNSQYISKLPFLIEKTETVNPNDAEFWLCQHNPSVFELHNSKINHYLDVYPEHKYKQIKIRDYRYDVCNKGQSSGLDLNKYVKNCIDIIGTSNITNICDIGCGMGEHSKLLLSQYPNLKFTGIDWSQLTINYLNNNTSFFHEIVHCKSNNLPFNNKQFSVALCMENLEHLYANDCIDAFKELKRISEYIIITIPRPEYIVNRHWLTKEISEASNDIIPLSFTEYIALESCVHKTGYYETALMHAGFKKCHIEHPYNGIYFCESNELDISKIQYTGIDSNNLLQTSNYKEKYIDLLHKSLNLNFIQNQPKIIDCFIFYNELDLLTYRLNILNDTVDYFVLVEATHTFVGKEKPLFYQENKHLFEKFNHKIIHIIVDDFPHKYPNIDFEKKEQWNNEKFQRNCISRGIQKINLIDNDIIILSDVDEIPNIEILQGIKCNKIHINEVKALQMDFYYYNLHSKLDHYTDVARMLPYYIYQKCNMTIDDLRFKCHKSYISNAGWHLSYFGNEKFIQNKIENFAHQELNIDLFTNQKKIQERIQNAKDLFDRPTKIIYIEIQDNDNLPPKYDIYLKPFYITNLTITETI